MNIPTILNHLNPTGFNNTVFYPLLIITIGYSLAFLLVFYNPKNRKILICLSVPIVVSIICVSANALYQLGSIINTGKITNSLFLFQLFVLLIGMLILGGIITEFKVKYMYVSHYITLILHACFHFYCTHYDAGVISKAFHPTFEYLVLLVIVYSLICSFLLLDDIKMGLSVSNRFLDLFIPTNEKNSHTFIVLLQAYSMIIHSTFMAFMCSSTFDDYWTPYAIALFVVLLQLINLTLKGTTISSQLSLDDLKDYTKDLNSITIEMGAKYDVYKQYENNPTDYITRRLWNINNCWGSRK